MSVVARKRIVDPRKVIRELRKRRGIHQYRLAFDLGVDQATMSQIENCRRELKMSELVDACLALGITPNFALGFTEREDG